MTKWLVTVVGAIIGSAVSSYFVATWVARLVAEGALK